MKTVTFYTLMTVVKLEEQTGFSVSSVCGWIRAWIDPVVEETSPSHHLSLELKVTGSCLPRRPQRGPEGRRNNPWAPQRGGERKYELPRKGDCFLSSGEKGPAPKGVGREVPFLPTDCSSPIRLTSMTSPPIIYARAKRMRRQATEAESRLWYNLRNKRLNGFKFYRQVPIGPYVADFLSHEFGLVIEVDGATHGDAHEVTHDQRRTTYLEARGLKVLCAWNHDVFTNINGVCDTIVMALEELKSRKGTSPSHR